MKLKNKLLPFVGVAALGATFAPIALTSCKSNASIEGAIDLREWYSPTIEKHAFTTLDEDEVYSLYFCGDETAEWGDWMDEDEMNERLTQDYLFGSSMYVQYLNEAEKLPISDILVQRISQSPRLLASAQIMELTGVPNAVKMEQKEKEPVAEEVASTNVDYNAYNVAISNVRINHGKNYYYSSLVPVEFPTISFQLEYEIDCTVETAVKKGSKEDDNIWIGTKASAEAAAEAGKIEWKVYGGGTTNQTHKGTITVENVPVKLQWDTHSELAGSKAWSLVFDWETIWQTELSKKCPFNIYGTDNVTYDSNVTLSKISEQFNGTTQYSFDYYSNMMWEKLIDTSTGSTGEKVIAEADKAEAAAKKEREASAIEEGKEMGLEDDALKAYVLAECTKAGKAARKTIVVPYASYSLFTSLNEEFFGTASYYLLSVAKK